MKQQYPLMPEANTLSDTHRAVLSKLEKYDMSFVFDKLVADGKVSESKISALECEFKRFIALTGFGIFPLAMIGPLVDEVWHQFILFTKQYKEFCQITVGKFIGHLPNTPTTPVPVVACENFRSAYRRYFGDLPNIWFEDMTEETKQYYLQSVLVGEPPARWSGWTGLEE